MSATAADATLTRSLPRTLGVFATAAAMVGAIIGSGIFRVPSEVAQLTGSAGSMLLAWIVGGVLALCVAVTFSERGIRNPQAGGLYVYLRETGGRRLAFIYGWTTLLINPAGWAGIALVFAAYACRVAGLAPEAERWVATATVLALAAVNYRSVRAACALQSVTTLAKVTALVALALFLIGDAPAAGAAQALPDSWLPASWSSFVLGLVAVLWAYDGASIASSLAGEVREPRSTLPRAMVLGMIACVVCYLLINFAYLRSLPFEALVASPLVAADATAARVGDLAAYLISALVMVSTFGALSCTLMADPRITFAMARDGMFFRAVGRVHPTRDTPHVAIVIGTALAVLYVWVSSFEQLIALFVLGQWPFYALTAWGLLRLRRAEGVNDRHYVAVAAVLVVVATFIMVGNGLLASTRDALINLAIFVAGVPGFWLWQRLNAPRP